MKEIIIFDIELYGDYDEEVIVPRVRGELKAYCDSDECRVRYKNNNKNTGKVTTRSRQVPVLHNVPPDTECCPRCGNYLFFSRN